MSRAGWWGLLLWAGCGPAEEPEPLERIELSFLQWVDVGCWARNSFIDLDVNIYPQNDEYYYGGTTDPNNKYFVEPVGDFGGFEILTEAELRPWVFDDPAISACDEEHICLPDRPPIRCPVNDPDTGAP